ncbi:MAG: lytic transglycosylase domain-containing protein, partial [Solirubrobacteraceae bacterium]
MLAAVAPASARVAPSSVVEEVAKGLLPGETTETTSTQTTSTQTTGAQTTSTQTSSAPSSAEAGSTTSSQTASSSTEAPSTPTSAGEAGSTTTGTASTTTATTTTTGAAAPSVRSSRPQAASGHSRHASRTRTTTKTTTTTTTRSAAKGAHARAGAGSANAPSPGFAGGSGLPPLPFALRTPISGVPGLFIESLDVPPFLLPIYQAAGIAYEVPWEVLAAINEVETDYGNDLAISSAGAEGWMQFMPAEWQRYGVDATGSGWKDPFNPEDAIFAAARYLQAAGASRDIRAAVFSYNHSQAYVEAVMLRARLLEQMPPDLLGAVTSLAEGRFPVHARSRFSDGFGSAPSGSKAGTLVGTTIHSEAGAPVVAVKDGTIVALGSSPSLGRYVSLRDADGNVYTYAQLGSLATLYPVLRPSRRLVEGARPARPAARPQGAASAGVQARSPVGAGGVTQSLAL